MAQNIYSIISHNHSYQLTNNRQEYFIIAREQCCWALAEGYIDNLLLSGERLTDEEVDTIIKLTGLEEDLDGNVKYEGTSHLPACELTPSYPTITSDMRLEHVCSAATYTLFQLRFTVI